ncbi:MAG: hypothetical protein IPN71_09470 [Fibrobacteres bacterium]|nr:hypothetical protein [Fibrobacterota bacterium]
MKSIARLLAAGILFLTFASCEQTVLSSQPQAQDHAKDSVVQVANPPTSVVGDGLKTLEVGGPPVDGRLKHDSNSWVRFRVDSGKRYQIVLESKPLRAVGGVHETSLLYPQFQMTSDSLTQFVDFYPDEPMAPYYAYRTGPAVMWLRSDSPEDTAKYRVSVVLDTTGIDAYEPDDLPGKPSRIETDGVSQSRFLPIRDHDWISFPMEVGMSYRIVASGGLFGFDLHQGGAFEDSTIRAASSFGSRDHECHFTASRTARGLIDVSGYGPYQVSVKVDSVDQDAFEPDGIPSRANWIQANGDFQSHVLRAGEVDYVRFHGDSGARYEVAASFQGGGKSIKLSALNTSDTLWRMSVPGPDGIPIPFAQNSTLTTADQGYVSFLAKRTGEFLIEIRGDEPTARGPYLIWVNRNP